MSEKRTLGVYELYARYFPALVTGLPALMMGFYVSRSGEGGALAEYLAGLRFFGTLSLSAVLLYFYAQLIRTTSKYYEKRYFKDARGFPTTYLMLYSDTTCSRALKDQYRECVRRRFGLSLPTEEQEDADSAEALRILNDTTKRVILTVGDGELVGKHNQWYGFMRNLVGGCIYGTTMALVNAGVGWFLLDSVILAASSLGLALVYGALFIARRRILTQHAEAYAHQLVTEFVQLCDSASARA